jgi:alkylation response protein AidB-like acyl-CoA dehydrogenase
MALETDQIRQNRFTPFTEEHEMFRKSVRALVEKAIRPYIDEWEGAESAPLHEMLRKMGDLGFWD